MAGLKGKRVSFGLPGSGVGFTADEILKAYNVPLARMRRFNLDTPAAMDQLKQGRIDAFFAVSGVPLDGLSDLLASHTARLVPITGPGRTQLTKNQPALEAAVMNYPGQQVGTVATRACGSCATAFPIRWSMTSRGLCSIRSIAMPWPEAILRRARSASARQR